MASARFHGNVRNLCPGRFGDNIGSLPHNSLGSGFARRKRASFVNFGQQHDSAAGRRILISAQLPTENLAAVEAAIVQHIRTLQTELVTDAEISRIRTQVANRFIFGNETPSDRAVCTVTISRC